MRERQVGIAWLPVTLLAGAALMVMVSWLTTRLEPEPILIASPMPTATAGPIRVYVSGAVVEPAVYTLPAGSIVDDLVRAAGGMLPEADPILVNLAQPLVDGSHIHVSEMGESQPLPARDSASSGALVNGLININLADQAALEELPGIGPAIAGRIIAHRQSNGPFGTIAEIEEVSGIGPVTFEKIRDLITVGQ
ncbi:MAG: ComEA family DNA-binding protein [Candidatus Promineifilaceae bacterium]|nr:ComEA family DNA-binding protein [Candidatus Promineifilaceae bacterium]